MQINSNIAGVMRQVLKLRADVPVAAAAALAPELWALPARKVAEDILLALAQPNERGFIVDFIEHIACAAFGSGGLLLRMRSPFGEPRSGATALSEAQAARGALSGSDLGMGLFQGTVSEFEEMILEWVQTEKNKDSRDLGKSDEDIAHLISYILLSPNLGPKGIEARDGKNGSGGLSKHIAEFLERRMKAGLPPETINLWMRAVLAGWRELLRLRYPEMVRGALRALKGGLV